MKDIHKASPEVDNKSCGLTIKFGDEVYHETDDNEQWQRAEYERNIS